MKKYKESLTFSLISFALFFILRIIYPIPDFTPDSRGYIYGAITNSSVSFRPLGYSFFLRAVHNLNASITAVAYAQFFLMLGSMLLFVHTIFAIFPLRPVIRKIIFAVVFINPPLLLLANAMLSDSLFISLTLIWISLLLRILLYQRWMDIAFLLLTLWLTFFVRYNVMIYPVIGSIVLLFFLPHRLQKTAAISFMIMITVIFYLYTKGQVEDATDTAVFSGFSGWQMANNAMSVYEHTPDARVGSDDPDILFLDSLSKKYNDSVRRTNPSQNMAMTADYMWNPASPFQIYKKRYLARNPSQSDFAAWTAVSVTLNEYGGLIIKKYPLEYFHYFLLTNTMAYLLPEKEDLAKYQAPSIAQLPVIREWYDLPAKITSDEVSLPGSLVEPFRYLFALLNLGFLISLLFYLFRPGKFTLSPQQKKIILTIGIFWLLTAGFNILASPVTYRYVVLLVPLLLSGILALWINYKKIA